MAKRFRLAYAAAALIPLSVLAAACGSSGTPSSTSTTSAAAKMVGAALPTSPAKTPETITETGSTLLYPLMGTWSEAYQKAYPVSSSSSAPLVTIETGGTGSGTGISDAAAGTVNIGASDAYLSSSDMTTYPTLKNIALAISAQQFNYNLPTVKAPLKLDGTVVTEMYTGKITKWNDPAIAALNPGVSLPDIPVVPLHRADGSGDTFLFTSYLNAQDPSAWPSSDVGTTISWPSVSGALAEEGNGGMVTGCGATKGCIAYIGISYESKTQAAGLGQALLKNGAGQFEAPTSATISAEAGALTSKTPASETLSMIDANVSGGYPIINYEYAIVNDKQTNGTVAEDIRAFLYWTVHTGQSASDYLSAVNFQPLPASVVTLTDNQIAKIGS
ncbi:MAG TPA: phosphate ABC transporter substrate-binding protein PstS [Streptosporangiaceae bacterium]|nr:phosphate ABC transporter substrate-binding protein PstS [Streptosporangiaceae bacterium]